MDMSDFPERNIREIFEKAIWLLIGGGISILITLIVQYKDSVP